MRRSILLAVMLLLNLSASAQSANDGIAGFGWLAGCWEMKDPKKGSAVTEMWMTPEGDSMLGAGRTLRNGKMVDFEFMRIVRDPSGIAFIARPAANSTETAFRLVSSEGGAFIFENPQHDFPQRVIYRNEAKNSFTARVEGMRNGKLSGIDFSMIRTACEIAN